MSLPLPVIRRRLRARLRLMPINGAWLIGASLMVAVGLLALGAVVLRDAHEGERVQAIQSARNVVSAISADLARNIELFDLSLHAVIDNLKHPDIDKIGKDVRQLVLFDRAATAKHLGRIHVLDANGDVVLDSRMADPVRFNGAHRDYFRAHRDNPDVGLLIGRPFVTRSGRDVISISLRLSNPDGSFAGVVAGMLRLEYVKELFERVNLGRGSALTLTHTDGTMLMRSPFVPGVVGRNVNGTDVFRKAMTAPAGTFEAAAGVDGINRLYTARAVEDLPLIVLAGLSTDELYAHWFGEVYSIGAIVLLLALATVGLAAFAARELRQRARAERRLTMLATTDALTGISNRRRFDVMLDREWKRARRQGASIALLMIDVDNFKGFNDRNGHLAGDRALARIAACIAGMTREGTDIVARYGGEEIVVLLPNLALDEAMAAAERMRIAVAELDVAGEPALPTVSIGVASVRPSGIDTSASLVAAADRALYQAKRRGRNRVESGAVSAVDAASLTQAA